MRAVATASRRDALLLRPKGALLAPQARALRPERRLATELGERSFASRIAIGEREQSGLFGHERELLVFVGRIVAGETRATPPKSVSDDTSFMTSIEEPISVRGTRPL